MNETQKRIKAYKDALPGLRERVVAVALLLAISLAMVASASFAWVTLSRAPEVTDVATNVAANGNLEIALAGRTETIVGEDGTATVVAAQPEESRIGDSSAAKGQSVVAANLTWGNLINLSDASYGLDKIILRPAKLGEAGNLLNVPLISVDYGADGRTESQYNQDFAFTNWNAKESAFMYTPEDPKYGVRAVSTIKYDISDSAIIEYRELIIAADSENQRARGLYRAIIGPDKPANMNSNNHNANIKAITGLMGDYMYENMLGDLKTFEVTKYVNDIYNMMLAFEEAYAAAGSALAGLANVQLFNMHGSGGYTPYTEADLWDATKMKGIKLDALAQYKTDVEQLKKDIVAMKVYYDQANTTGAEPVLWTDIEPIMNRLVKISTCTVAASKNETPVAIKNLGKKAAMGLMGTRPYAVIHDGLLKNFEQLTGERMNMTEVKVDARIAALTAESITTAAKEPYGYYSDKAMYCAMEGTANLSGMAKDTYGMVVDFWVRTNAADSCLILEGNVLTREDQEPATLKIPGGETVPIHTATVTYPDDGSTDSLGGVLNTSEFDVYMQVETIIDQENQTTTEEEVWYYADNHEPVYVKNEAGEKVSSRGEKVVIAKNQKMNTIYTVIGYEGENRVWEDWKNNEPLKINSTTQGSGSCYVFYAENPTEQEKSMQLLSNLRIAFLDGTGVLVAKAGLDTNRPYEDGGKVIVPLVLLEDGDVSNKTYYDDGKLAVMPLKQNESARLTMVVYLEGTNLTNDQVLAAEEIKGQLNVQFGSSVQLQTWEDDTLKEATWSVTAAVDDTEHDLDDESSDITHVTIEVEGIVPNNVSAFFIRQINATQGSREEVMNFVRGEDGKWTAEYEFRMPGTYVLRSVQLDGQDYELSKRHEVTVEGFKITGISCDVCDAAGEKSISLLTGERYFSTSTSVSLYAKDEKDLPKDVKLQFVDDETKDVVTVPMKKVTGNTWEGTASFHKSGSYTLKNIIMDGYYDEIAEDKQYEIDLTLGVYVRIIDDIADGNRTFEFNVNEPKVIGLGVEVYNDVDEKLSGVQKIMVRYGKAGSGDEGYKTADLTWNAGYGRYEGTLLLNAAGVYSFHSAKIGTSDIESTDGETPVYTLYNPNPTEYVNRYWEGGDYTLLTGAANDTPARLIFQLHYAEAAQLTAVFTNTERPGDAPVEITAETMEDVDSEDRQGEKDQRFAFTLPKTEGTWQLTELTAANVVDVDGKPCDEEHPLVWNMEGEKIIAKVDEMKVNAIWSGSTTYGVDKNGATVGTFMESYQVDGTFSFEFTNKAEKPLRLPVADKVTLVYQYSGNSAAFGGYTADHLTDPDRPEGVEKFTLTAEKTEDGKFVVTPGSAMTLPYAGEYKPVSVSFGNYAYDEDGGNDANLGEVKKLELPTLTVKTKAPTVAISAISPTGTFDIDSGGIGDSYHKAGQGTPSISSDKLTATVYFKCSRSGDGSTCNPYRHNYSRPSVTLTLSGVASGSTATMSFGSGAYVYNGTTQTEFYSWTGNGTCGRNIGDYASKSAADDGKTPAGTITSNSLVVNHGGNNYTFTVPTITINNPS